MKKKTLEERKRELQQTTIDLLKSSDRIFQLKFLATGRLLTEEEILESKDLPYDIETHCRTITKLKHKIKKLEEEQDGKPSSHETAIPILSRRSVDRKTETSNVEGF